MSLVVVTVFVWFFGVPVYHAVRGNPCTHGRLFVWAGGTLFLMALLFLGLDNLYRT